MPPFKHVHPVRFGDIDHAGIVYYPRFFHYVHVAFEEMFGTAGYKRLLDERHLGFPAVHVEFDFEKPLRYGDSVEIAISRENVGRSSVTLRYQVTRVGDGAKVATAKITTVAIDLRTFSPVPVPDDLRALFEALD